MHRTNETHKTREEHADIDKTESGAYLEKLMQKDIYWWSKALYEFLPLIKMSD